MAARCARLLPFSVSSVPCMSIARRRRRVGSAGTDGSPIVSRPKKAVTELGAPSVVPSNPNSRPGRKASPHLQGRVQMEACFIGIDVAKDRLDIHVRPTGEAFPVPPDRQALAALLERLRTLKPQL